MDMGLKGKNVLITGASRNMGRIAAIEFAREGANLAICTSAKMRELNAVADELRALGANVVAEKCDVADPAAVSAFVGKARGALARSTCDQQRCFRAEDDFLETSDEKWQRNIDVNLTGPRNICRAVLPGMVERKWGRIINFSGIAPFLGVGRRQGDGQGRDHRSHARDRARVCRHNVTANCIGPGTFDVERDAFQRDKSSISPAQPIRRHGKPMECASLMLYLRAKNAGFITGQCYLVNGGMYFQ